MSFYVVLLIVFLQLNQGLPSNPLDKTSGKLPSFIINGKYAKLGEFPHQLALVWAKSNRNFCGAALISPTQALTAAHCVIKKLRITNKIKVVAGVVKRHSTVGGQVAYFKKIVVHPKYDPANHEHHDFAILTFKTPLKLNKNVQPIAWNQDKNETFVGEKCVLSGWGRTLFGSPDVLKKVEVDVISNANCSLVSHDPKINPTSICAYTIGSGACNGDSGGPMTCQHSGRPILAGVTTFGYVIGKDKKCNPDLPSVYTRVSEFEDFIQNNLDM